MPMLLPSDYKFLEEVNLVEDVAKRCEPPVPRRQLPAHLKSLVFQAKCRNVDLQLLAPGMHKRKVNSTRYDGKGKKMNWRVEWSFVDTMQNDTFVDVRLNENTVLKDAFIRHLNAIREKQDMIRKEWQKQTRRRIMEGECVNALYSSPGVRNDEIQYYDDAKDNDVDMEYPSAALEDHLLLMKVEGRPANDMAYHRANMTDTLHAFLHGKRVIEFPTFLCVLSKNIDKYTILKDQGS